MKNLIYILFASVLIFSCKDSVTFQEQLDIDIDIIETYLSENGITAIKDPSGLYYKIDVEGTGTEHPTFSSIVSMAYTGKLLDGTIFDSANSTSPLMRSLQELIQGWQIGVPKFKKGGKGTLYIPSGYAYGVNAVGSIPGNSVLIFDIELLNFN